MTHSLEEQPRLAARSRTNAALVFAFHSDLRRVPAPPVTPAKRARRAVRVDVPSAAEGSNGTLALITQVAKWVAMLAAIAAPWILLLTG